MNHTDGPSDITRLHAAVPRQHWAERRRNMETDGLNRSPAGVRRRGKWSLFDTALGLVDIGIRVVGLRGRGIRNALDIRLNRLTLTLDDLPPAFDGFRILHISDLHLDGLPAIAERAAALAASEDVDLCVMTGDFLMRTRGPFHQILPSLEILSSAVRTRYGIVAVLGNHDQAAMVPEFESRGITVLVNEHLSLARGGARIHLSGTDDVHCFYTDDAVHTLDTAPEGFRIALIHSPEIAAEAAARGFHLYLCGHTHGGQISLPTGRPVFTRLVRHREHAVGLWRHGPMQGYTSSGLGISGLPIRFNTRGEMALLTLRSGTP